MLKQKLRERNTYTPTSTPQARSNCDSVLNSSEGRNSVQSLKTSFNSPDEELTLEDGGQNYSVRAEVSVVYVLNSNSSPLMPTTPKKAKTLLKKGKAHVVNRTPFTKTLQESLRL